MPASINIAGRRYGRLVALEPTTERSGGKVKWRCRCDCGQECLAAVNHLQDGRRVSCGCAIKAGQQIRQRAPLHGHYVGDRASPTYHSWSSMRSRCSNPNVPDFHRYGGRGVKVCARWNDFQAFLADMGVRPAGSTLDRKDVNGNYEPGNCRWATGAVQDRNRRGNLYLSAFGRTQILADWSREFTVPKKTITDRLKRGLTLEQALRKSP